MRESSFSLSRIFNLQLVVLGYLPLFCFALFIYFQLTFFLTLTARKSAHQTALRAAAALSSRIHQTLQHLKFVVARDCSPAPTRNLDAALSSSPLPVVNLALFEVSGNVSWEWKKGAIPDAGRFREMDLSEKIHSFRKGQNASEALFEIDVPLESSRQTLKAWVRLNLNDSWAQSLSSGETGSVSLLSGEGDFLVSSKTDPLCASLSLGAGGKNKLPKFLASGFEFPGHDGKNYWAGLSALSWGDPPEALPVYVLTSQDKNEVFALLLMLKTAFYFSIPFLLLVIYFLNRSLSKWVLSPLEILYQGIQKAASGDLSFKTRISSASEIGDLSKNFDSMIEKLNAAQLRLEADKQALLQLNQSILASLTTGILVIDPQQKVLFMNPAGEQLMGVSFDEAKGRAYPEASISPAIQNVIRGTLEKNQGVDSTEVTLSDRTPPSIFGIKTSFLKQGQGMSGLIVAFNNITDRKRLETELAQNEKMLSLALLSAGMAHDFNNLLNRIKLSLDVISKNRQGANVEEIWKELHNAVDEGRQMTRSLCAFTRNESVVLMPVNLKEFIRGLEKKHAHALQGQRIVLKVNADDDVWIRAEPYYLGQIFQNLIQNAEQALSGKPGAMDISLSLSDSQALIRVRDSGPGMTAEVQARLFEPFFSTKVLSSHSGWGLGLALVKSLVENMRGEISVRSAAEEGTVFSLRFPVIRSPLDESPEEGTHE